MRDEKEIEILGQIAAITSEAELLKLAETLWAEHSWLLMAVCYRRAAELGSVEARYLLGECYETGMGVVQSDEEAVKWYKEAASRHHGRAMCVLADYYYYGNVVEQSDTLAQMLLLHAGEEQAAEKWEEWFGTSMTLDADEKERRT